MELCRRRSAWARPCRRRTWTLARRVQEADAADAGVRPYTLERAVAIALRNNRQLAVSQYDLEVANKQVSEAYGALFPEIDGFASLQRNLELPSAFLPEDLHRS